MRQDYQIKQYICTKAAIAKIPVTGTFELTPRCNFQCKMCYVRMTPEEMVAVGKERSTNEWLDMGRQACDAGMTFLLITGGEPTLRPDFPEIYRGLSKLGLSISINTNGSLLNDKIRELFTEFPPALVNVTLYGTSPESYKRLCGNSNGFERALESIRWLRDYGINVRVNTTITPWNVQEIEKFHELAKNEAVQLRLTTYTFPPARRTEKGEFQRLPAKQIGKLLAEEALREYGMEYVRKKASIFGSEQEEKMGCSLEIGEPMECHAGRSQFWITWNGNMVPCGMLNSPITYPFRDGFKQAWKQLVVETETIRLCPECAECPEVGSCMNCAAVTTAETGKFDGKPEYMCEVNRSYREAICLISGEK